MQLERLSITFDGGVAVVRFSNPPHEFMDDATARDLGAALDALDARDDIGCVVLTGAGEGVFIRHFDVGVLEKRGRSLARRGLTFGVERPVPETPLHICYRRIETSRKPFVAALNGTAMGGGFELALSCDIRLVEDGPYSLGLPEVNIGLLPGAGGTQRLTRLVGQGRALELMLLGRTVTPREAVAAGLASECVSGPVLPRALEVARELASKSARAIGHIKYLVRGLAGVDPDRAFAEERTLFCDLMVSEDGVARMKAMNDGRMDIRDRTPPGD